MSGIRGAAVAGELAQDARTAGDRVLALLEQEDTGALRDDEPVPAAIEGTRCLAGRPVGRGERPEAAIAGHDGRRQGRLGAPGQHGVGPPAADEERRKAQGVARRSARRGDGRGGTVVSVCAGHRRDRRVCQREWDGERTHAVEPFPEERAARPFEGRRAAVHVCDHGAAAQRVELTPARVRERLSGGDDGEPRGAACPCAVHLPVADERLDAVLRRAEAGLHGTDAFELEA